MTKMINKRYAHRGYHSKPEIPENSIPAFKRAIERGWGAELDVHLLRDGTLAVIHDSDLVRLCGVEGSVEDLDFEGMKALRLEGTDNQIPTFDEVLALFEETEPLIIELKVFRGNYKELSKAVMERLDSYKGDFCIESFDPRAVLEVKKLRPNVIRGQLAQDFTKGQEAEVKPWQRGILTNLRFNMLTKPDFIAYKYEDRANKANRRYIKHGVQEVCWTIRSKETMLDVEKDGGIPIFECFDPEA